MVESVYKIKLKFNRNEIEISGDRDFIKMIYEDVIKQLKIEQNGLKIINHIKGSKENQNHQKHSIGRIIKKPIVNIYEMSKNEIGNLSHSLTNDQIIIFFAYYIKKVMKKRYFKQKDIDSIYTKFNVKKPKTIPYYLRKLSKGDKNHLEQLRKQGRFKISENGILFIERNINIIS